MVRIIKMRMMRVFWYALVLLFFAPANASAVVTASAQNFHPSIDTSKYFSIYSSQTMQKRQWGAGMYLNYAYRPVEFGVAGTRVGGIIDDLVMADFYGTYGITDWVQVGIDMPVAIYEKFFNPALPPGTAPAQNVARMGDLRLEGKFRLLNDFEYPVGLSVRPFITFPTGSGAKLVGNNSFAGGLDIITDIGIKEIVFLSLNVGFLIRETVRPANLNVQIDDQFTFGLGVNWKAIEWMDVIGEMFGSTNLDSFFSRQSEVPLEALGGLRFRPTVSWMENWTIGVGGGAGLTFGYGSPDFRVLTQISYLKPRIVDLPPPPPPPPSVVDVREKRIHIAEKIHFEFDKASIRPVSFAILDAVVDALQRHPEIRKVQIEGYTDAVGPDEYNLKLSQRRANSVLQYLVKHGVAKNRLQAKGFGESNPIADNDTALGRARNRRTEFKILERTQLPPDVVPATY